MLTKTEELLISLGDFCDDLYRAATSRSLNYEFYYFKKDKYKEEDKKKFYLRLYKLRRDGYITDKKITPKGLIKIIRAKNKSKKISDSWDGKWRIVIFDIPENKRKLRNYFRKILDDLNFIKLQNSVWVSPYDNFVDLKMVIENLGIKNNVIFILSIAIENENIIIKRFFKDYNIKLVKN
jgi:CRISPR-associated endonuclease Cas2